MSVKIKESTDVVVGGKTYHIAALDAMYGLDIMLDMTSGEAPKAGKVMDTILKSVKLPSGEPTREWFNLEFSRRLVAIRELYDEIIKFNFPEFSEGKVEGDTEEE